MGSTPTYQGYVYEAASPLNVTMTVGSCLVGAAEETGTYAAFFNGFQNISAITTTSSTVWTRTSTPPGIQLIFDLYNSQITTVLSGPPTQTGNLSIYLIGYQNSPTVVSAGSKGPGLWRYPTNLTLIPADQYSYVTATWANSLLQLSVGPFTALGTYRFSTYSVSSESLCAGSQTPVYVFENNQSCTYYYGFTFKNDFASLATNPNPKPANATWNCSDQVLLMNSSGTTNSIKAVQDYCPACSLQFNGTSGHIDAFNTSNQSCNPHSFNDLGSFFGVRLR